MQTFGWFVLALVFLDEVLAAVAAGIWGGHVFGVAGAVLDPDARRRFSSTLNGQGTTEPREQVPDPLQRLRIVLS